METLLKAYTISGAWINRSEKDTGSLEPGKAADFVIVDRDILAIPILEVGKTQVLSTYIDGKKVFQREPGMANDLPTSRRLFTKVPHFCPCREQLPDAGIRFLKSNGRLAKSQPR